MGGSGTGAGTDDVWVWRAARPLRLFCYVALAALLVLSARVVLTYGYLASIGVLLVLAIVGQVWWTVLRPRLVAGPAGVDVVAGRVPVHLDWRDIRRAEAGPDGLTIFCADGRAVVSRFPQQTRAVPRAGSTPSEADRVAVYLVQRGAWARRPTGPQPPRYQPPVP